MVGCCHDNCSSQHNKHSSNMIVMSYISNDTKLRFACEKSLLLSAPRLDLSHASPTVTHADGTGYGTFSCNSIPCVHRLQSFCKWTASNGFTWSLFGHQNWGFSGEVFLTRQLWQFRGSMDDFFWSQWHTTMYLFKSPFKAILYLVRFRFTLLCISNRYQLAKYLTKCNILLFQIHLMS